MNLVTALATIGGVLVAALGLMGGWVTAQRNALMKEIRRSVDGLKDILIEKLETKEKVAELAQKVAILSVKVEQRNKDDK